MHAHARTQNGCCSAQAKAVPLTFVRSFARAFVCAWWCHSQGSLSKAIGCLASTAGAEFLAYATKFESPQKISNECASAVSRDVEASLFFYNSNTPYTEGCDADVDRMCHKGEGQRNGGSGDGTGGGSGEFPPGVVHTCMVEANNVMVSGEKKLTQTCSNIVSLSGRDKMMDKIAARRSAKFAPGGSSAAASGAGETAQQQSPQQQAESGGIVVTGFLALASIVALVVVILGISFFVYRTYVLGHSTAGIMGGPGVGKNPYTLIVKSGDV